MSTGKYRPVGATSGSNRTRTRRYRPVGYTPHRIEDDPYPVRMPAPRWVRRVGQVVGFLVLAGIITAYLYATRAGGQP